ncbi:hypothetical protein HPB50_000813 [Hyalomma asiaticum]|uniref:Uncharacterized protein n=1 Tax=Hyalomma asiaticum TaxID=266040 RepID=A0ACB7SJN0_HYAAI|nr:hypothetical protein HPB50_000813 [Hyalomma asiaticum]
MKDTQFSSDDHAHSLRFVTVADCSIPLGEENVITLTSDAIVKGDVFLAPCDRWISVGLVIEPSPVQFHDSGATLHRGPLFCPKVPL